MKKIIIKTIFLFLILSFSSSIFAQSDPFVFDPDNENLGNFMAGDEINFSFDVIYVQNGPATFFIGWDYSWITSVEPDDEFTVQGPGDGLEVTIEGVVPAGLDYGTNSIILNFYQVVGEEAEWVDRNVPTFKFLGNPGFEDWVEFTEWDDSFSEGDIVSYKALFHDEYPYGDQVNEWNLKLELFTNDGPYTYWDIDQGISWWQNITAPNLPQNVIFERNSQGQIRGLLTVTAHDTDGYDHTDNMEIGINKEPDPPTIYTIPQENNTVNVIINNSGGTNNLLYYDFDSGEPYTGTGLVQGNSPISMGNSTTIELEGFTECSEYYFAAKATNQFGTSDYSPERGFPIISSSNGMPIYYHFSDYYISNGYVLEDNHFFMGNLIIESGATVPMVGGTLYFDEGSKIIIEPGGKLILDGTTCTAPCDQTWKGIEVWGDPEMHQHTVGGVCAQGILELKGGATIENAEIGVLLASTDVNGEIEDTKTGGVITANFIDNPLEPVANFINNRWAIRFYDYKNYSPFDPKKAETSNRSLIENCTFDLNEDYLMGDWSNSHIHLYKVSGVHIRGNTFINNEISVPSGHGINAYNAGFRVESICNDNISPCPETSLNKNTFTNFTKGINLVNGGTYTLIVKNAKFNNNSNGVILSNVDNAIVLFNKFYLGETASGDDEMCDGKGASYGIDLTNCVGFAVEENKFYKATGAPLGNYIGIRVTDCPSVSDVLYLNEFYDMSIGIQAEGENKSNPNSDLTGITYYCNHNSGNNLDFHVADLSTIGGFIGTSSNPSGNKLSSIPIIFQNDYFETIIYYFDENEPDEILLPAECSGFVFPLEADGTNSCSSHYGGTGGRTVLTSTELQTKETEYYQSYNDYNNVEALYVDLVDGGDTESLKAEVETSWPQDMWELRAELLGNSPHLSKEVLMAAADKTDVLPESVIFEVLSANPDELRKEDLIKYLEDKENPLPTYMIDILRQVANGSTYKTVLLSEMASHHDKKIAAAQDIIRSIINEDEPNLELMRNWLDNIGGLQADRQIIETYIAEGDYVSAQSLMDMLPGLYSITGDQLQEYNDFKSCKQLLMSISQQQRTIFELTNEELEIIIGLAENGTGRAHESAKGILEFAYGYNFCNCPDLPSGIQLKSGTIDMQDFAKARGLEVSADPNPATTWTAFDYTLPLSETEGIIEISDNLGKTIQQIKVTQQKGQYILDTRVYKPGVYYYTLTCGDLQLTGKLIVN